MCGGRGQSGKAGFLGRKRFDDAVAFGGLRHGANRRPVSVVPDHRAGLSSRAVLYRVCRAVISSANIIVAPVFRPVQVDGDMGRVLAQHSWLTMLSSVLIVSSLFIGVHRLFFRQACALPSCLFDPGPFVSHNSTIFTKDCLNSSCSSLIFLYRNQLHSGICNVLADMVWRQALALIEFNKL